MRGFAAPCAYVAFPLAFAFALAGAARAQESADYTIGPRDVIRVTVAEVPSLNVSVTINEAGQAVLPLIGDISVQGRTPQEVSALLRDLLEERYVQRATVSVTISEYRSRAVVLTGAVQNPGSYGLTRRWTLLEAILAAGSLTPDHGGMIQILRRSSNGLRDQIEISVEDLFDRADPRVNIPLRADDLISIPKSSSVTVYILGEVARAGPVTFNNQERPTLLAALARAGGLGDRASDKIRIRRGRAAARREPSVLEVDYKQLVRARVPDVDLEEGDVVIVKRSIF